jgi:hypothetical protein
MQGVKRWWGHDDEMIERREYHDQETRHHDESSMSIRDKWTGRMEIFRLVADREDHDININFLFLLLLPRRGFRSSRTKGKKWAGEACLCAFQGSIEVCSSSSSPSSGWPKNSLLTLFCPSFVSFGLDVDARTKRSERQNQGLIRVLAMLSWDDRVPSPSEFGAMSDPDACLPFSFVHGTSRVPPPVFPILSSEVGRRQGDGENVWEAKKKTCSRQQMVVTAACREGQARRLLRLC